MVTRVVPVVPFLTLFVLITSPLRRNCSISASDSGALAGAGAAAGDCASNRSNDAAGLAARHHIPLRITRASAETRRLINTSACILRPESAKVQHGGDERRITA